MQNFDHNIVFWEKRHFFAENCDHNIDPCILFILRSSATARTAKVPKRLYLMSGYFRLYIWAGWSRGFIFRKFKSSFLISFAPTAQKKNKCVGILAVFAEESLFGSDQDIFVFDLFKTIFFPKKISEALIFAQEKNRRDRRSFCRNL
jgi:hypothetical protein